MKPAYLQDCVLVIAFVLTTAPASRADILFKNGEPIGIGKGAQSGSKISWTNCAGKDKKEYDKPPYSLDRADNCTVGPAAFGVECRNGRCEVVNPDRLKKYLFDAKKGDTVELTITATSVTLRSQGKTIRMDR